MVEKVFAQGASISTSGIQGITLADFPLRLGAFLDLVLALILVAAFFSIIFSGYLIITSGGDAAKAAQGRKGILMGIIGIVVISLAFVIVRTVGRAVFSL